MPTVINILNLIAFIYACYCIFTGRFFGAAIIFALIFLA